MIKFDILTLFPEMLEGLINNSILKRAIDNKLIECNLINFRDFSGNKHSTVDDYAYSGGAGMLIRVDPIHRALESLDNYKEARVILTSPSGKVFTQEMAKELSQESHIIIICGHYEGIDARVLDYVNDEISIGDYVLTGGEMPAGIIMDAISRLVPGVISENSPLDESFSDNLLEYPQYTRPQIYDGKKVPDVLVSGHHANIKKWQRYMSLKKTYIVRPDILEKATLSDEDKKMLEDIKNEKN